ncbi:hypothetical protein JZ751_005147 [Albula glossodonta]|uniref:Delta(14)-sterol reductase LBR n=1 Tax=Albula glossodonta TaxID=121402 RepID=A0A8T2PDJ7_9TELE|nr:hypothetical protein JZ751_005147 [Albula glossodonta]
MPSSRFQNGDMVMGRWPGSSLYYEVKVMSYDPKTQLYTVMYKDGTELELKESDIRSLLGFRQSGSRSRSRSRSPSRRHSRSRSPGRSRRRSSSRSREPRKDPKLKEVLEKSDCDSEKGRVSARYNLRRRKEDATKAIQQEGFEKKLEDLGSKTRKFAIAKTTELEFGGRIGAPFMLLFLPAVVYTLLLTCSQKDASILNFPPPIPPLHTLWSNQVFGIMLIWLLFQALLYMLPIGKVVDGMPLNSGKKLKYRINVCTCTFALNGQRVMNFLQVETLIVINFALLLTEMKLHKLDSPSPAMILVNLFQLLYVADGLWNEEAILTTMDIVYEGFGFMLAFGDLVWVPFTYTLQAFYLVNHPNPLSLPWIVIIFAINSIGYYVFRKANSQKNAFRRNPSDPKLSHLRTIPTATGKSLLVSGFWGIVRHPNYLGDLIMALAWSLPCGFTHILPYYYVIYFTILLIHRDARDEKQCRKKYGSAWDEYCREVRYRIIPGVY